ncbi:MAG: ribosome small subunit-dependent GTPase A [Clostridia bacterium]|nr:ribosome small subunit-dependent GTPase A [Clostridia bacterium]
MEKTNGRIIKGLGGLYEIKTDSGKLECRAKGVFRHEKTAPTVGDLVTVGYDELQNPVIAEIHERKNILIRPPLANMDTLFCVIPTKDPEPDLFTLDKLIAIAESLSIEPVIVITKIDLDREKADELASIYKGSFRVFQTTLADKESVSSLRAFLESDAASGISAFAGASGAGKSTLMNLLFPTLSISTNTVSRKTARGRHTTRHVELFPLSELLSCQASGYIADTPGFSMLDFERFDFFDKDELPLNFREFADKIGKCRYTRCTHLCEEGCAIYDAVKSGEIPTSRHNSYVALYNILKNKKPWDKKRQ